MPAKKLAGGWIIFVSLQTKETQGLKMAVFILEHGYNQRETTKVMEVAGSMGHDWCFSSPKEATTQGVPVGSVKFCESFMEPRPCPDPYPEWLLPSAKRSIELLHNPVYFGPRFLKPAWGYKVGKSKAFERGDKPVGVFWSSRIVSFTDEFRYYIAKGSVVAEGWYDGPGDEQPVPSFPVAIPENFCGAVDFGYTGSGDFVLVESHHPYACGHYSEDHVAFAQWLIDGWEYMKEIGCVQ